MILIIDDDVPFGNALERMFRYNGFDSVFTANPLEALSLLDLRKPRLILIDLQMPIMSGWTLLRAIRQDTGFSSVPIVIYSSDFSELSQARALAEGAHAYFVKGTLGSESLLSRVRDILGDQPPRM